MQISQIMHEGVISVNINDTVRSVAELMKNEAVGAVPVLDNGKPVGFVTDRDIVVSCVANGHPLTDPISHAMTDEVISVRDTEDVQQATKLMKENHVSRLLVVDQNQKPIGIVSVHDLGEDMESRRGKTGSKIM
jgi:predicted transcriptional regulator